ncbi:hypothetical protein B296_00058736 [Ensete ventricosum]|uniref:Acidic protein n=1 Tax=Ensete ventricosum TaxID=4639 RepID=A0A426X3K0_ENSVE|nr:hypothetical protein B296_00058736 [Ensete ventricosum]
MVVLALCLLLLVDVSTGTDPGVDCNLEPKACYESCRKNGHWIVTCTSCYVFCPDIDGGYVGGPGMAYREEEEEERPAKVETTSNMGLPSRRMVVLALCLLLLVDVSTGTDQGVDCDLAPDACYDDCRKNGHWVITCSACYIACPDIDGGSFGGIGSVNKMADSPSAVTTVEQP